MNARPLNISAFKYLSPLTIYVGAIISFTSYGWLCYIPLMYSFGIIPAVEILFKPDGSNLSEAGEEMAKKNRFYDWILYVIVILEYPVLFLFLKSMLDPTLSVADMIGRITAMGLICGTFGINIGHELGHRVKPYEQWLAKLSLMTSLYMHFFIEHNRGHHKRVATPEDPSSARYGETVYGFWIRSITEGYKSAWHISNNEMKKKGKPVLSFHNEMIQVHLIQAIFLIFIFAIFGYPVILYYLAAAFMGILLLETVNYIEHYGLSRKLITVGKYERAMPEHSWNSDHVLGRIMLFELSRHSDHHYLASRKYQVLRHHDTAPQMPTGYPGMMLLSLVPPIWFRVMNSKISNSLRDRTEAGIAV
ncbi:MAG: alkane 1-monooxygenase [Flavitalea sp.]